MTFFKKIICQIYIPFLLILHFTILACSSSPKSQLEVLAVPYELEDEAIYVFNSHDLNVISSSTLIIPVSDFSKIINISCKEVLKRIKPGDPRNTALIQELASRMFFEDTSGNKWSLLYFARLKDLSKATTLLKEAGIYSLTKTGTNKNDWLSIKPWLNFIALLWALWLLFFAGKKPSKNQAALPLIKHTGIIKLSGNRKIFVRLHLATITSSFYVQEKILPFIKFIFAIPFLFMNYFYAFLVFMLYITLIYAFSSISLIKPGKKHATFVLSLISVAFLFFLIFSILANYINLVFIAIVFFSALIINYLQSYIKKNKKPGRPSSYIPIIVKKRLFSVYKNILTPLAVFIVLTVTIVFSYSFNYSLKPNSKGDLLLDTEPKALDVYALLAEHIEFQNALTYGRLGEASEKSPFFTEPYSYSEKDGKVLFSTQLAQKLPKDSLKAYEAIIKILKYK